MRQLLTKLTGFSNNLFCTSLSFFILYSYLQGSQTRVGYEGCINRFYTLTYLQGSQTCKHVRHKMLRVLYPYLLTRLSNGSVPLLFLQCVLYPYLLTRLSNVGFRIYRTSRVLYPYLLTRLSNTFRNSLQT